MTFISFAITKGQLYKFKPHTLSVIDKKEHGNIVVYGGIYLLHDDSFHIRSLDALHNCSLSSLGKNHLLDEAHRVKIQAVPIRFDTLDDLDRLKYEENESITAEMYVANTKHPKINQRTNIKRGIRYRIVSGIDKEPFKQQYTGVIT